MTATEEDWAQLLPFGSTASLILATITLVEGRVPERSAEERWGYGYGAIVQAARALAVFGPTGIELNDVRAVLEFAVNLLPIPRALPPSPPIVRRQASNAKASQGTVDSRKAAADTLEYARRFLDATYEWFETNHPELLPLSDEYPIGDA